MTAVAKLCSLEKSTTGCLDQMRKREDLTSDHGKLRRHDSLKSYWQAHLSPPCALQIYLAPCSYSTSKNPSIPAFQLKEGRKHSKSETRTSSSKKLSGPSNQLADRRQPPQSLRPTCSALRYRDVPHPANMKTKLRKPCAGKSERYAARERRRTYRSTKEILCGG